MPQAQDGDEIEEDEIAQFKPADEVWRLGGLCHIGSWKMEDRRWEANAPESRLRAILRSECGPSLPFDRFH